MIPRLLLLPLLFLVLAAHAATNTAQLSFHCQSVRLQPASAKQLGQTYTVSFTTVDGEPNGELGIDDDPNAPTFLSTVILLEHPILQDTIISKLFLDVPEIGDADLNRVSDFFQVSQAVENEKTLGAFEDETFGLVTVEATWNRAAGSTAGTCRMVMEGDIVNAEFAVPFEILQYVGPIAYTPATNVVVQVNLQRQGAPGTLSGLWHLSPIGPGELTFPGDEWRDEAGNVFGFIPAGELEAYLTHVTRQFYNGLAGTFDGMPATPVSEEYIVWEFNVFDDNDADDDRVPDLSDPPGGGGGIIPVDAVLSARVEEGFLKLSITARKGQSVIIERKPTLANAEWTEVETITLTADAQVKDLPLSGDDSDFYRVRTP